MQVEKHRVTRTLRSLGVSEDRQRQALRLILKAKDGALGRSHKN